MHYVFLMQPPAILASLAPPMSFFFVTQAAVSPKSSPWRISSASAVPSTQSFSSFDGGGAELFSGYQRDFSQLTEATRKLQARSAKGALTVSMLPSFAIQWLVPRLTGFNSAYPGIDVRIQAVDRQEDKLADDVDVAIFLRPRQLAGAAGGKAVRRISAPGVLTAVAHRR